MSDIDIADSRVKTETARSPMPYVCSVCVGNCGIIIDAMPSNSEGACVRRISGYRNRRVGHPCSNRRQISIAISLALAKNLIPPSTSRRDRSDRYADFSVNISTPALMISKTEPLAVSE